MVEEETAGAVGDGGRVQDDILGATGRRQQQELLCHRQQRAVREHGALGMPGGAGGVEEPGHVVGLDGDLGRILVRRPGDQRLELQVAARAVTEADEPLDRLEPAAHAGQMLAKLFGVHQHASPGVVEHVSVLVGVHARSASLAAASGAFIGTTASPAFIGASNVSSPW